MLTFDNNPLACTRTVNYNIMLNMALMCMSEHVFAVRLYAVGIKKC